MNPFSKVKQRIFSYKELVTFVNNQLSFYFRSLKRLLELFNNSFPLFHLPLDLMDFFIINIYYNIVQVIYSCNFFQEIKRILCYRFSLKRWFNISSSWNSWKYPSTIIYMIMHTYLLLFLAFRWFVQFIFDGFTLNEAKPFDRLQL